MHIAEAPFFGYFKSKYWNNLNLELDLQMAILQSGKPRLSKKSIIFAFAETHSFLVKAKYTVS